MPEQTAMPVEIFGTFTTSSSAKPTFNSLNYLRALSAETSARLGEGTFHVVKMFSDYPLEADMLDDLFGMGNVSKTVVKRWLAYPKLEPVTKEDDYAPVRPDEGLYYPNSFERLISTMETAVSHVGFFESVCLVVLTAAPLSLSADCVVLQRRFSSTQRLFRLRPADQLGGMGQRLMH